MIIEIDDSGTGDLVGDAFIGIMRQDTGEIIFKRLPVDLFKGEKWKDKAPLKVTVEKVKEALEQLNFDKKRDKILLCRGNIFDELRNYFDEEGIKYEPAKIDGKLQDAIEGKYVEHLRKDLGVRSRHLTKESGAKRYFVLFNWVCRDFYNREKYVKSGFKKWNSVWREKAIEKYEKFKRNKRKKY